eukprot:8528584-Karenia_brevis.AAC.1
MTKADYDADEAARQVAAKTRAAEVAAKHLVLSMQSAKVADDLSSAAISAFGKPPGLDVISPSAAMAMPDGRLSTDAH